MVRFLTAPIGTLAQAAKRRRSHRDAVLRSDGWKLECSRELSELAPTSRVRRPYDENEPRRVKADLPRRFLVRTPYILPVTALNATIVTCRSGYQPPVENRLPGVFRPRETRSNLPAKSQNNDLQRDLGSRFKWCRGPVKRLKGCYRLASDLAAD
jgi:hypothetical protein